MKLMKLEAKHLIGGFTLIEVMAVLGVVVILSVSIFFSLSKFSREQTLVLGEKSILTMIKDAQQRSINQESERYWGVRLENISGQDRYSLFNAADVNLTGLTITSTAFLKASLGFIQPALNITTDILFDKISGRALISGCPSTTVNVVIELATVGNPSNSKIIKVYCSGRIES